VKVWKLELRGMSTIEAERMCGTMCTEDEENDEAAIESVLDQRE
jgi:hypothetical protein